jgi:hypothetical protein
MHDVGISGSRVLRAIEEIDVACGGIGFQQQSVNNTPDGDDGDVELLRSQVFGDEFESFFDPLLRVCLFRLLRPFFALMDKFGKVVLGARGLITHDGRGPVMQVSWGHGLLSQIPGSGIYDNQ